MRAANTVQSSTRTAYRVIALAVACGLGLSLLPGQPAPPDALYGEVEWLTNPRPLAQFTLASSTGEVTADSLRGHWQLLVLGFTQCPDVCPATLAELAGLQTATDDEQLRVVFVSVDPNRDSPLTLAAYVQFFGEGITGITGELAELRRLANSLGMDFRHAGRSDEPRISHSPTIALIDPDGYLRGHLRPGFDIQRAARDISTRLGAAS